MDKKQDGGPAFPISIHPGHGYGSSESVSDGMSLRAYAAIHLRVPMSGIDWLDDMIARSDGAANPGGCHPNFETVRYRTAVYDRNQRGPSNARYVPTGMHIPSGWWLYEFTSVDEIGPFDKLYRHKPEAPIAPDTPGEAARLRSALERLYLTLDPLMTPESLSEEIAGIGAVIGSESKARIDAELARAER